MKPETRICQDIIRWVRTHNGFAIHFPGSTYQKNQPDVDGGMIVAGGFIHFKVEVKLPGEEARPAQLAMLDVWSKLGYVTGVVHNLTEFIYLVESAQTYAPSQTISVQELFQP